MALSDLRALLTRPLVGRVFNCAVPLQLVSVGLPSGVHVSRRTLLLAGAALPLAGCSTSGQWQAVTLDAAPTALAPLGTGLLIGTAGPALAGPAGAIAVTTSTPYGNEANWVSLATHGERIVGLGTTHGGATPATAGRPSPAPQPQSPTSTSRSTSFTAGGRGNWLPPFSPATSP